MKGSKLDALKQGLKAADDRSTPALAAYGPEGRA